MSDKKAEQTQKTEDWAEMSDNGEEEEEEKQQDANAEEKPKVKKPIKGTKNKDGDYVITTLDIPDMRTGINKAEKTGVAAAISDDSSDEGYGDEDEPAEETPAVEEKKEGKFGKPRKTMVKESLSKINRGENKAKNCKRTKRA